MRGKGWFTLLVGRKQGGEIWSEREDGQGLQLPWTALYCHKPKLKYVCGVRMSVNLGGGVPVETRGRYLVSPFVLLYLSF